MDALDPTSRLLLALACLLLLSRGAGALARRAGQPPVLAELAVGVLLGPSLMGAALPEAHRVLFGPETLPVLDGFGQLGLILLALRTGCLIATPGPLEGAGTRGGPVRSPAAVVGAASFLLPLVVGGLCGLALAEHAGDTRGGPVALALFLGCALGVTAIPVLVRLLEDEGLTTTATGRIALASAAMGDAAAWLVLSVALVVGGALGPGRLLLTAGGALAAVLLSRSGRRAAAAERPAPERPTAERPAADVAVVVAGCALAAGASAALGLHHLLGALLFGFLWGRRRPGPARALDGVAGLADKVLLPCFFLGFGQRLDLGSAVWTPGFAVLVAALLLVAVAVKTVGCAAAGSLSGMPPEQWLRLGVLMNARGLTEIVVLTVGYDAGLIDGVLLTALTVVALATTAMAGPALRLLDRIRPLPRPVESGLR